MRRKGLGFLMLLVLVVLGSGVIFAGEDSDSGVADQDYIQEYSDQLIPPPLPQESIRFNTNASSVAGVANAFRWEVLGFNKIGFIRAEAFAGLIDGVWDGTYVWGYCRITGDELAVTMAPPPPSRGIVVPGTVWIIRDRNRVYLPLRYFAERFNFIVRLEGNMIVFS